MLPEPAALLPLVPEELRDREPADRLLEPVGALRRHPRQRGGHLRAKRHLPPALVGEGVQLRDDFLPALVGVEIQRLERRAVVLLEAVPARHPAHGVEEVGPEGEVLREKIPKAREGIELHRAKIICSSPPETMT